MANIFETEEDSFFLHCMHSYVYTHTHTPTYTPTRGHKRKMLKRTKKVTVRGNRINKDTCGLGIWVPFRVLRPMPVVLVHGELWLIKVVLRQDWTIWASGFVKARHSRGYWSPVEDGLYLSVKGNGRVRSGSQAGLIMNRIWSQVNGARSLLCTSCPIPHLCTEPCSHTVVTQTWSLQHWAGVFSQLVSLQTKLVAEALVCLYWSFMYWNTSICDGNQVAW